MDNKMSKKEMMEEARSILRHWQVTGYTSPYEIPECEEKNRYRELLKNMGFKVEF